MYVLSKTEITHKTRLFIHDKLKQGLMFNASAKKTIEIKVCLVFCCVRFLCRVVFNGFNRFFQFSLPSFRLPVFD